MMQHHFLIGEDGSVRRLLNPDNVDILERTSDRRGYVIAVDRDMVSAVRPVNATTMTPEDAVSRYNASRKMRVRSSGRSNSVFRIVNGAGG